MLLLPNFSSVRHSVIQQHSFLSTIHLPTPLLITWVRPVSQEEETQRDFQRLHPPTGLTAKTTGEKVTQPPSLDGALMGKNPVFTSGHSFYAASTRSVGQRQGVPLSPKKRRGRRKRKWPHRRRPCEASVPGLVRSYGAWPQKRK